ncbi:MAG: hypothetical protein H5T99_04335, partial [Moorella sp. (in: Bacteria)]|nr:hypothetical protein [Moorella sp. (in: firmicutes)]
ERDLKLDLEAGILAGKLTALTTTFPGGQVANMIDKIITTFFVMGLLALLRGRVNDKVTVFIVPVLGTLVSGAAFLGSALLFVGLPGPFEALFTSVVLPATLVNTIAVVVLYPLVLMSERAVTGSRRAAGKGTGNGFKVA